MIGFAIFVAVLLGICMIPIGVSLRYDSAGAKAWLLAGTVHILLYPKSKKSSAVADAEFKSYKRQTGRTGGKLSDFLPFAKIAFDLLSDLRKKIKVTNLVLKLVLAGGDPCDLSIRYGRAWAVLGNALPLIERIFNIKKRDIDITCDYVGSETLVVVDVDMKLSVGRALILLCKYGVSVLRQYFKIYNNKKAVQ